MESRTETRDARLEKRENSLKIVVMGVSGCGKSRIGAALAQRLDLPFFDADDFHSAANVEKMARGAPLTDADRAQWLTDLSALIQREPSLVLACSALKAEYRGLLRAGAPGLQYVYLQGDFDTILQRLSQRRGHYFKGPDMLLSQFTALEEPAADEAILIDIRQSAEEVLTACLQALDDMGSSRSHPASDSKGTQ
ncbi:Gluconate kinase [Hahella chejuensis KCTC 2396]|uniref:Gluconokinase n=1 Tax=Hahella chejuensis (strain KCTC 2396) TaxID=349521 RepID=Q2SGD9_HAHCH|nr:Gluconate kinase [Hahella chejuensis KCTC 2396]